MQTYYQLLFQEEDALGVAHAPTPTQGLILPSLGLVESWKPLQFWLKDGKYPDYLANDLGYRLCSERLRGILDRYASPIDLLQWLEAEIRSTTDSRKYYILHFPNSPNVLDPNRTIVAGNFVVKAVLSKCAVDGHHVFGYPNCGQLPLFVSDDVRQAIKKEKCIGIHIAGVPME